MQCSASSGERSTHSTLKGKVAQNDPLPRVFRIHLASPKSPVTGCHALLPPVFARKCPTAVFPLPPPATLLHRTCSHPHSATGQIDSVMSDVCTVLYPRKRICTAQHCTLVPLPLPSKCKLGTWVGREGEWAPVPSPVLTNPRP